MKIETVPIESLSPDPVNAREHDDINLQAIESSLRKFGQQKPIVVGSNEVVIAGNGTLEAARRLGWDEIKIVRTNLESQVEQTAFGLADNKTAELADWDFENLSGLLSGLQDDGVDLGELGFQEHELNVLLNADWEPPETDEDFDPEDEKAQARSLLVSFTGEEVSEVEASIMSTRGQDGAPDIPDGELGQRDEKVVREALLFILRGLNE